MAEKSAHIYGPVFSRRLGVSLGVDLVPLKTCTFDCIYCQLGPTTCLTRERASFTPVGIVLEELRKAVGSFPALDYITLAGSGEPTLHDGIGDIILGIRSITGLPIAVLTNGSLLSDSRVRQECGLADVVLPNLDAGDDRTYERVNRPLPGMTFKSLVDGLIEFRKGFGGRIWLEVMLLHSVTDSDAAVTRIARCAREIHPDCIHLNTAVRPACEPTVRAVSLPELTRFANFFKPEAQVVGIPDTSPVEHGLPPVSIFKTVLRRPCTLEEIARLMKTSPVDVIKILDKMVLAGQLDIVRHEGKVFFKGGDEDPNEKKLEDLYEQG